MTHTDRIDGIIESHLARLPQAARDYIRFIEDFVGALESGGNASGDCETDIAAFQEFVDRGGSMADLTAAEVAEASTLMSSIGANCSDERFQEWSQDEDIQTWISG